LREPATSVRRRAIRQSFPVYRGDQLQGLVYLNSDFANAVGYSGKPIQILFGIDPKGVITGLNVLDHKEPSLVDGIQPDVGVADSTGVAASRHRKGSSTQPERLLRFLREQIRRW